jgi:hypothetical protein
MITHHAGRCYGGPYDGQYYDHWSTRLKIARSDFRIGFYGWDELVKCWRWEGWS